ncbi:hypothetical protein I3842_11G121700 [Carya illinoinensis]|uniref:Uncharacterized protein n=1 Tax=Carya illinoinensis TaxID=32201 RepID=A0A922DPI5_CARIL|nr:hypothetical protein I3842_11G121700 [Carya illinoinensis]
MTRRKEKTQRRRVITLPLATNTMASMQSHKPADETCHQNPSLGQKVAQMIGLAPKQSHHGQPVGHGQTQCCGQTQTEGHYQAGNRHANSHGKTEKKTKGKKSKGRDGKSCSGSDSSSDSD